MGLDMYLEKKIYIGANYDHNEVDIQLSIKRKNGQQVNINPKKVIYIIEDAIYWRKANEIHAWFVEHVQGGEDDCKEYDVSREQLTELYELVCKVSDAHTRKAALEYLPPASGFFFGSTEVDEWYWEDIERTREELKALLLTDDKEDYHISYIYNSSW